MTKGGNIRVVSVDILVVSAKLDDISIPQYKRKMIQDGIHRTGWEFGLNHLCTQLQLCPDIDFVVEDHTVVLIQYWLLSYTDEHAFNVLE